MDESHLEGAKEETPINNHHTPTTAPPTRVTEHILRNPHHASRCAPKPPQTTPT
jgi:hypothetical protein